MKEPVRRSSRTPRRRAESPKLPAGESRNVSSGRQSRRKRKSSVFDPEPEPKKSNTQSSSPAPLEVPKFVKKVVGGRRVDSFCWICHKVADDLVCNSCPRSYHKNCLIKKKITSFDSDFCECKWMTVDGSIPHFVWLPPELAKLLKDAMQEAVKEERKNSRSQKAENVKIHKYFKSWPVIAENERLLKIVDIDVLIDRIHQIPPYQNTGEFFLDVKWIYHNCCILFNDDHEITDTALKFEKKIKQELLDIEACRDCYKNKHSEEPAYSNFFTNVCHRPHKIVWAKLRDSPFWPAKCLKIHNGHADVRFFGTHDKSNVSLSHIYRISRAHPEGKDINKMPAKLKGAMDELSVYISNYENAFGHPFEYYEKQTFVSEASPRRRSPRKPTRKGKQTVDHTENASVEGNNCSGLGETPASGGLTASTAPATQVSGELLEGSTAFETPCSSTFEESDATNTYTGLFGQSSSTEMELSGSPVGYLSKTLCDLLMASKPSLRHAFLMHQTASQEFFLKLWSEMQSSRQDGNDLKYFQVLYGKFFKVVESLKKKNAELLNLTTENASLEAQFKTLTTENASLEAQFKTLTTENASQKAQIKRLLEKKQLREELSEKIAESCKIKKRYDDMEKAKMMIRELEEKFKELSVKYNELEERFKEKEKSHKELYKRLEEKKEILDNKFKQLQESYTEVDRWNKELEGGWNKEFIERVNLAVEDRVAREKDFNSILVNEVSYYKKFVQDQEYSLSQYKKIKQLTGEKSCQVDQSSMPYNLIVVGPNVSAVEDTFSAFTSNNEKVVKKMDTLQKRQYISMNSNSNHMKEVEINPEKTKEHVNLKSESIFVDYNTDASKDLINESTVSGALLRKNGISFDNYAWNPENEDSFFNHTSLPCPSDQEKRVEELIRRNSILPHHLQSSYPIEMNLKCSAENFYVKNIEGADNGKFEISDTDESLHSNHYSKKRKIQEVDSQSIDMPCTPVNKILRTIKRPSSLKKLLAFKRERRNGSIKPKP